MTKESLDWTHKNAKISDIRKSESVYVIEIKEGYQQAGNFFERTISPLFIKDTIFEERISSYFFKDISKISRECILGLKWNMYITKGYYIKIDKNIEGKIQKHYADTNKWYVSYLEIAGPLASFDSICNIGKQTNK